MTVSVEPEVMSRTNDGVAVFVTRPVGGGSRVIATMLCRGFAERGMRVIGLSPMDNSFQQDLREAGLETDVVEAQGILRTYGGAALRLTGRAKASVFFRQLLPYNRRICCWLRERRIAVLYASDDRAVLLGGFGARRAGVPVVWHVQGGLVGGSRWIHRLCGALATRIVCVSHSVAADVSSVLWKGQRKKVSVVYNGAPDLAGNRLAPAVPPNLERRTVVLYCGRLTPAKGVHHLIEAVSRLAPDLKEDTAVWITGSEQDDPAYATFLQTMVGRKKLEQRVLFLGQRCDIPDLMAACDIVCCPSVEDESIDLGTETRRVRWKEGFCLAAIEGMRAAKPVVGSRTYGIAEVVAENETGLLCACGIPGELSVMLKMLIRDPSRASRFGMRGRQRFLERFHADRTTSEFSSIVEAMRQ